MQKRYGLIFDVDGVIADSERVNAQATCLMFEELFGLTDMLDEDFRAGLGRGAEEYVKAGARSHGMELTNEQVAQATKGRQDNFLRILKERPLKIFPGVMELMRAALNHDQFGVAVATSGTRAKSQAVLQAAGVPYENMVYINGDLVTHKKPNPQLFQLAVEQLHIPARNCVVIEDSPTGVAAARAAGCLCIAVTNSTDADKLSEADMIVDTLEKVDISILIEMVKD